MERNLERDRAIIAGVMAFYGAAPKGQEQEITIGGYIEAIELLHELNEDMSARLAGHFPPCHHCTEDCYYHNYVEERLFEWDGNETGEADLLIPAELLVEAGLDPRCRLEATVDDGAIIFAAAIPGIEDLPTYLLDDLYGAEICFAELDKRIAAGEVLGNG